MPKCLTQPAAEAWVLRWKNRRILRSLKSTWNEMKDKEFQANMHMVWTNCTLKGPSARSWKFYWLKILN